MLTLIMYIFDPCIYYYYIHTHRVRLRVYMTVLLLTVVGTELGPPLYGHTDRNSKIVYKGAQKHWTVS